MKKNLIIYGILALYLLFNVFVIVPNRSEMNLYNELINPLMWIVICVVAIFLGKDSGLRVRSGVNKTQSLLIVLIIYIILYFLSGLIFGFERTPYSKDILSVLLNLWSFGSIIILQEYVRLQLVKNENKKMYSLILTTLVFFVLNLNYSNFLDNFTDFKTIFIYASSVLLPAIAESAVLTYLIYTSGVKASIIYRLFVTIPPFLIPIVPSLDWFVTAVVGVVLPLAVYIYINYVNVVKNERLSRGERKRYSPVVYIPVFALIAVFAAFVMGLFKYQPVAVLSGSMSPTFNRGDAVIINKLTKQEKNELKKGDIIQFISGTRYVVHRIYKVTNDEYGNKAFITKGDHNNAPDSDQVSLDNVIGKVSFSVPLIGYPSVWLTGVIS